MNSCFSTIYVPRSSSSSRLTVPSIVIHASHLVVVASSQHESGEFHLVDSCNLCHMRLSCVLSKAHQVKSNDSRTAQVCEAHILQL